MKPIYWIALGALLIGGVSLTHAKTALAVPNLAAADDKDEGCVDNDGTEDKNFSGTTCTKRSTCKVDQGSDSKCMKKSDGNCYCTNVSFSSPASELASLAFE